MAFGVIYVITNLIDGMKYVGQTTRSIEQRFKEHMKAKSYIGSAIRDVGVENFSIEIIAECSSKEELNEKNFFFIEKFDCMAPNGYNLTEGGQYCPLWENGSGFMLCYIDTCKDLVKNVPQASVLRVFFHIAFNQSYDIASGGGFKCSRKHLQETLNLTNRTIISALKWLEENFLVKEAIINGQSDFMVNPDYATIGKNKKFRVAEWNRRCQAYIKKLESKKTDDATNKPDSSSNSEVVSG